MFNILNIVLFSATKKLNLWKKVLRLSILNWTASSKEEILLIESHWIRYNSSD